MGLYEELETINRAIKREALDMADFRILLPGLLKKYKECKDCPLHRTMEGLKDIIIKK